MKLYTEEQVCKAIKLAQECDHECGGVYFDYTETEIIEELTPIELPSDGEIIEVSHNIKYTQFNPFANGAIWMRDKIQGGQL